MAYSGLHQPWQLGFMLGRGATRQCYAEVCSSAVGAYPSLQASIASLVTLARSSPDAKAFRKLCKGELEAK